MTLKARFAGHFAALTARLVLRYYPWESAVSGMSIPDRHETVFGCYDEAMERIGIIKDVREEDGVVRGQFQIEADEMPELLASDASLSDDDVNAVIAASYELATHLGQRDGLFALSSWRIEAPHFPPSEWFKPNVMAKALLESAAGCGLAEKEGREFRWTEGFSEIVHRQDFEDHETVVRRQPSQ